MTSEDQRSNVEKLLIAGIGNRLMGDDGFGPRVVDLLESIQLPRNVELRDFGTAGLTIATNLSDYDVAIFLDSISVEGDSGQLHQTEIIVEEDLDEIAELSRFSIHEVGLEGLLKFAKAIGTLPSKVILIGCVPNVLQPSLDLSPMVAEATHRAVDMVQDIIKKYSAED